MAFKRKKKSKQILAFILSCTIFSSVLSGCSKVADNADTDLNPPSSGAESVVESQEPEPEPKPVINPLTGVALADEAGLTNRPVAVMINNIKVALPQRGLADASVIYEMPVEGGVTRMMAVYDDVARVPTVGSIRSARHDFVELANGLGAIFVHFGWSDSAKAAIPELGVENINGTQNNNFFFLDEARAKTRSSEHCWYTNSELVQKGVEKFSYETKLKEEMKPIYSFSTDGKDVMEGNTAAVSATEVTATFASGVVAGFTYDPASKRYVKSQYGGDHMDENVGSGFSVDNVFLVYTSTGFMADNYHREIKLEEGAGYYISGGMAVPVTFKKSSKSDLLRVYAADGTEQAVNPGTSYVCFLPKENQEKLKGIGSVENQ